MNAFRSRGLPLLLALLTLAVAGAASAQMQIKVNDNTFVKFGLLMQTQGDALQDPASRSYSQNVFIRRARLLIGGQIAPNLTFFAETDSPNLGKQTTPGTKNIAPTMFLQDAYVEFKASDKFAVDAGLMLVSPSRNGLQSAASLMALDYGPHTFANSGSLQASAGRDTGMQAKGYFDNKRFEYRFGLFQGMRDSQNRELRTTARVQYNVFDTETSYFYTGTYLGKKKILAFGAGYDHQHGYKGWAADAFLDYPLASGAITAQFDHIRYDGTSYLKGIPNQNDTLVELGYLIGKTKWMPIAQIAHRNFAAAAQNDETRVGAGVAYFLSGHNANVKATYTRIDVKNVRAANQVTVQLQLFYF